jgi:hypothetical protein
LVRVYDRLGIEPLADRSGELVCRLFAQSLNRSRKANPRPSCAIEKEGSGNLLRVDAFHLPFVLVLI